jgi:hypothetical protein
MPNVRHGSKREELRLRRGSSFKVASPAPSAVCLARRPSACLSALDPLHIFQTADREIGLSALATEEHFEIAQVCDQTVN